MGRPRDPSHRWGARCSPGRDNLENRASDRTNKSANTIDSLYRRWRHKQEFVITSCKQVEYILVDEISMMREKFYAMLCHIKRAIPGIKMILIGDIETQFLPVKDTWEGNYETTAALYDLCDGYKIKLTKCRWAGVV